MKTLNYLLILIAIAAIAVSFIVIETDNKLIALSTASVCIAALGYSCDLECNSFCPAAEV